MFRKDDLTLTSRKSCTVHFTGWWRKEKLPKMPCHFQIGKADFSRSSGSESAGVQSLITGFCNAPRIPYFSQESFIQFKVVQRQIFVEELAVHDEELNFKQNAIIGILMPN